MDRGIVKIEGRYRLEGEITLSGAKNAALPLIVAACLGEDPTILDNVPVGLHDVRLQIQLMRELGADIQVAGNTVRCSRATLSGGEVPPTLASRTRTSLLLLGVFAGLASVVRLPHPGGCNIGERKHDLHLMGLRALGAVVEEDQEGIRLESKGLRGAEVEFYLPTTTGTENVMIAASMARGTTLIRNANTRPEVSQLGDLLSAMGAEVQMKNRIVEIRGVESLRGGTKLSVMAGRDEAVTYAAAAAATRGEIVILGFGLEQIREDARYLREAGVDLFQWGGNLYVSGKKALQPFELFTAPYPGVNSDMQPIFAALALTIDGVSTVTDLRFTDRFDYVEELQRFRADIRSFGNTAIITGGQPLIGARVSAPDLRGGMACVLCGLVADGETQIHNTYQIERGYQDFCAKLTALGAKVHRV